MPCHIWFQNGFTRQKALKLAKAKIFIQKALDKYIGWRYIYITDTDITVAVVYGGDCFAGEF